MKKSKALLALFVVFAIATMAGGVATTVQAVNASTEYKQIVSGEIIKMDNGATKEADKQDIIKYFALSMLLFFAFCISVIVVIITKQILSQQWDIICVSDGNELTFAVEKNADYESILQGADSYVPVLPPAYEEAEKPDSSAAVYIGNKNSKKFHYASCSSVKDMKEKNKVELNTREEAIEKGYVPCKNCNP